MLSLIPFKSVESIHKLGVDKVFHLIEYLILGIIFKYSINSTSRIYYLFILIVPLLDEFVVQEFSGRTVDYWDFIFNLIGLYLGIIIKGYFDKRTAH